MKLSPGWLRWPQTQRLIAAFAPHPDGLRFVGGAVRDALLGLTVQDVDAATTLLPEAVMAMLEKSGLRVIPTGIAHGTVTAIIDGKSFEITTLRKDLACDGRHADVSFTNNWKEDAARRDFTMNALYLSPQGELFDYFGGGEDAQAGKVRFIGAADQRIAEDYLRILRFFRFHAWYGKGAPDEVAMSACAAAASHIASLSGERIQHEMFKLLAAPAAFATLEIMQKKDILTAIVGFPVSDCIMVARFKAIEEVENLLIPPAIMLTAFILRASLPLEDAFTRLATRWRLSNQNERRIRLALRYEKEISGHMSEAMQKRLIRKLGAEDFTWAVIVRWSYEEEAIQASHPYHAMLQLAATWQPPAFPVRGDDLIALDLKPGKELGEVLKRLEEEWETSGYKLSQQQLLAKVK